LLALDEAMAVRRLEIEPVDFFQLGDALDRLRPKRRLPFEGMEDDALEKIAEAEIVILGEGLEHLQEALLHPHTGLRSLDDDGHGRSLLW